MLKLLNGSFNCGTVIRKDSKNLSSIGSLFSFCFQPHSAQSSYRPSPIFFFNSAHLIPFVFLFTYIILLLPFLIHLYIFIYFIFCYNYNIINCCCFYFNSHIIHLMGTFNVGAFIKSLFF